MGIYGNELEEHMNEAVFPDNYQCKFEVYFDIEDSVLTESYLLEGSDAVVRFHDKRNKNKFVDMYFRTFDKNSRNTAKGETAAHMNKISFKVTVNSKESQGTDGIPIYVNAKTGTATFDKHVSDKEIREIKNNCKDILNLAVKNAALIDDGWKVNMSDEMKEKVNKQKKSAKNSSNKETNSSNQETVDKNDKNNVTFTDIINMIIANNKEYSPEIIRITDETDTEGKNKNAKQK